MVDLQRYLQPNTLDASLFFWHTMVPMHWWHRVGNFRTLSVTVVGRGRVRLMAQTEAGKPQELAQSQLPGGQWTHEFSPTDYAWLWLDVADPKSISEVRWSTGRQLTLPQVTVVVPTFKREADAVAQTTRFLSSEHVGRVLVIDQGATLHLDRDFTNLRHEHPDRVIFIQQPNLGGSGGYARGMAESMRWPQDAVLLSDDDAHLPDEALRRMLTAQTLAGKGGTQTIMGTAMMSAEQPSQVVSAAEHVTMKNFMWGPADGLSQPVDVAHGDEHVLGKFALKAHPNYSGWWGTLLPPGTVANVGLPAPYFIKWDDAEYGLRAHNLDYRFLTLPGVGVWHPTWGAKSTVGSWMSMPLHRNRLATAAAYRGGMGIIKDSFIHQVKHILSLQYLPAQLWAAGIEQVLAGPESWLGKDLLNVRSQAQAIVDKGQPRSPKPRVNTGAERGSARHDALVSVTGLVRPVRDEPKVVRVVPAGNLSWRDGLGADVVVLTDTGGQPTGELRRRPLRAIKLLLKTLRQHAALALSWKNLQRQYARALPQVITIDYWLTQFGSVTKDQ